MKMLLATCAATLLAAAAVAQQVHHAVVRDWTYIGTSPDHIKVYADLAPGHLFNATKDPNDPAGHSILPYFVLSVWVRAKLPEPKLLAAPQRPYDVLEYVLLIDCKEWRGSAWKGSLYLDKDGQDNFVSGTAANVGRSAWAPLNGVSADLAHRACSLADHDWPFAIR
jgi:hypothetical protein